MIKGVLLDLSGVIYVGDRLLPGALEAIDRLHRNHVPIRYITNTTRSTSESILRKLARMGLSASPDEIYTAPMAARDFVQAHGLSPYLLIHPALRSEFAGLPDGPRNAVLMGDAGQDFSYDNLNEAFRLLIDGAPLLAMGNNRYFQEPDGLSLDIGPFAAALEYAADTKATILGKPAIEFFGAAVAGLGCKNEEAVMVGDDAVVDVGGALACGLQGVLVKTGKYRPGDEKRIREPGAETCENISAAVDWILNHAS